MRHVKCVADTAHSRFLFVSAGFKFVVTFTSLFTADPNVSSKNIGWEIGLPHTLFGFRANNYAITDRTRSLHFHLDLEVHPLRLLWACRFSSDATRNQEGHSEKNP